MAQTILSGFLVMGLAFAVGEVLIRFAASFVNIYAIEMWRYGHDLKKPGTEPNISHVHRPNASAKLMGVTIALNSLGQRGPEVPATKGPNEKRVLVMGSSITMGWGVPYESVFSARIERALNQSRPDRRHLFFNAGIGNYNTRYQVELFKTAVDKVGPDLVVLNYFIGDAKPNPEARHSVVLENSMLAAAGFAQFLMAGEFMFRDKNLADLYAEYYDDRSETWNETRTALAELSAWCKARKIEMVALVMPNSYDFSVAGPLASIYPKIMETLREFNIDGISIQPEMWKTYGANSRAAWVAPDDPHFNGDVHALMADKLLAHLRARNF